MEKRDWLYLFLSSAAWGSTFPMAKVLLAKITPLTYIIIRLLFGLAILFGIIVQRKNWYEFGRLWREERRSFLGLGFIITPGAFLLEFNAILFTTAVNQSIIINLQAIVVVILQVSLYKLRMRWTVWAGSIVAFLGIYLIIVRPGDVLFGVNTLVGDFLTILTALAWGAYTAVGEKVVRKYDPLIVMTAIFSCCLVIFIPLWIFEGGYIGMFALNGVEWGMLAYLGVICTGIAYWIWYEACRRVPAEQAAMFVYVSPLVAIVMGVVWLGEPFTISIAIGFLLTMMGLIIAEKRPKKEDDKIQHREIQSNTIPPEPL